MRVRIKLGSYVPCLDLQLVIDLVKLSTLNKQSFMNKIMTNNVLTMKFGLFCVEDLTKPITAMRVVDRDEVVQDLIKLFLIED